MKQLRTKFMAMLAIAGVVAFSSCDTEELAGPIITITTTPVAAVDGVVAAEVGQTITVKIDVEAAGGFNVLRITGGAEPQEFTRTEEGQTSFTQTITYPITAEFAGETFVLDIEAVDDADKTGTETLTINVAESPLVSTSSVILYGQSNPDGGSFYNLLDNTVLGYADARDASGVTSSTVDLAFFYGNTNLYTLAGINDADLNTAFSAVVTGGITSNFGKKNATTFIKSSITSAQFDAVATGSAATELANTAIETGTFASKANSLSSNNVLVFKLDAARGGLVGLMKVVSTAGVAGGDRTITVSVKYQE